MLARVSEGLGWAKWALGVLVILAWLYFFPLDARSQVAGLVFASAVALVLSPPMRAAWSRKADEKARKIAERLPNGFGIGGRTKLITKEWIVETLSKEPRRFDPDRFAERLVQAFPPEPRQPVEASVHLQDARNMVRGWTLPDGTRAPGQVESWIEAGLVVVRRTGDGGVSYRINRRLVKRVLRAIVQKRQKREEHLRNSFPF